MSIAVPSAPPPAIDLFGSRLGLASRYVELLAGTGIEHGLLGPGERPRLWERHVLNCAVINTAFPCDASVIDLGSGAGLPGIVLAVLRPDLEITLIERMQRRTLWLRRCVDQLSLPNVAIHHGRAESLWGRSQVPYVTARAVARLGDLAAWCLPLLKPGGSLLAIKGEGAHSEVIADRKQLAGLGATDVDVETYGVGVVDPPTIVVRVRVDEMGRPAVHELRRDSEGRKRSGARKGRR